MADLIKVSIQGILPGGEVWSVNPVFKLTTGSVVSFAECLAAVTAINALTLPTNLRQLWNVSTQLTGCRVEARTVAGDLEALSEGLRDAPGAGSGTAVHPFQTSLVSSLRTTTPGARGRGRLYWPATGLPLDAATMRITPTTATSVLGGIKSYLAAVQTAVDASVDETVAMAVWSRTSGSLPTVTSIQVGDVLDVQRRRRDTLTESVVVAAFP